MAFDFKKDDVLMNPEKRTAMFRILEINEDTKELRIVRSGKDGKVHGMTRDKNGKWVKYAAVSGWEVVGHKGGSAPAPKKPAGKNPDIVKTNTVGGGRISGSVPAQSNGSELAVFLRAQVNFHEAAAIAARNQLQELTGVR